MRVGLAMVALLAAGCARNAILELDVELPPTASAELRALSDPPPSYADPRWDDVAPEPLPEVGTVARIHLVAEGASIEAPLALRVRLCETAPCATDAPEVRVELERAFYVGRRTWLSVVIPAVPNEAEVLAVDHCAVGGCLDGDTLDFCRVDGSHYCE